MSKTGLIHENTDVDTAVETRVRGLRVEALIDAPVLAAPPPPLPPAARAGVGRAREAMQALTAPWNAAVPVVAPPPVRLAAPSEPPPLPMAVVEVGMRVGDYVLGERIGSGGMGSVYAAAHVSLGRKVAVKMLSAHLVTRDQTWRFFNEARASVKISHPSIVDVFHFGLTENGRAYMVMELLEGESLATRLERRRQLDPEEAVKIARGIALGLSAAHAAGIIHRDLKPGNVFLVPDLEAGVERVKLLDFGIAKLADGIGGPFRTWSQAVLGTPAYMPPEQWRASTKVDCRADLYSLGCLLYRMLSGAPPFGTRSHVELAYAHHYETPGALHERVPGLPLALHQLLARLLAQDPCERPASAVEVSRELAVVTRALAKRVPLRRVARLTVLVAGLVGVGAAALGVAGGAGIAPAAERARGALAAVAVPARAVPEATARAVPEATAPPIDAAQLVRPDRAALTRIASHGRGLLEVLGAWPVAAPRARTVRPARPPRSRASGDIAARTLEARRALHAGDLRGALDLCERALGQEPGDPRPLPVCVLAACRLHLMERARGYIVRLPVERRAGFASYCETLDQAATSPPAAVAPPADAAPAADAVAPVEGLEMSSDVFDQRR